MPLVPPVNPSESVQDEAQDDGDEAADAKGLHMHKSGVVEHLRRRAAEGLAQLRAILLRRGTIVTPVVLAGFLLLPPILAGRAPRHKGPASMPPWSGPVQGGVHAGDGRSVAPHRDAPAEGYDQEEVARGQAGVQATVIRDEDEAAEADSPAGAAAAENSGDDSADRA